MLSHHHLESGSRHWPFILAVTAVLAAVVAGPAIAHTDGEIRGGYYTDVEDGFLGGGLLMPLADLWYFNPNLEWVFVDGYDYWTVNADVHRDLNPGAGAAIWLGAGPALVVTNTDAPHSDAETDLGVNLFAGLGAKRGSVRPFTQFKVRLSDNSESSLAVGIRF